MKKSSGIVVAVLVLLLTVFLSISCARALSSLMDSVQEKQAQRINSLTY